MKNAWRSALPILTVAVGILVCPPRVLAQSGTLTNERALNALNQWLPGDGTKQVLGVLEIPAQNAAQVDLTLSNFVWNSPKNDAVTAYVMGPGGGSHIYNGKATAIFVHYTDGRWVLVSVQTLIGNFENLSIEAR